MTRRFRRAFALTSCTIAMAALSGCAAGFDAETEEPYAPSDGVIGQIGDIKLRNVLLVADEDNVNAALVAVIVNDGVETDELVGLAVEGQDVETELPQSIDPDTTLSISPVDGDTTATAIDIEFAAGDFVDVTFDFEVAGPVTLQALVLAPVNEFEDYEPRAFLNPQPSPSG